MIEGQFAFVLWDPFRRTLIAVTDAIGTIGIHYWTGKQRIILSTSPEALLKATNHTHRINENAIALVFHGLGPGSGETYYEDIHRVEPATCVQFMTQGMHTHKYWSLPQASAIVRSSDDEYADAWAEVIGDVCKGYQCETPAAVLLSGGLDSSTVAQAISQNHTSRSLVALSTRPESPSGDTELRCSKMIAERLLLDQKIVEYPAHSLFDAEFPLSLNAGYPLYSHHHLGWKLTEALQSLGVSVVYTGDGGDHLFPDSGCSIVDKIATLQLVNGYRDARRISAAGYNSLASTLRRSGVAMLRACTNGRLAYRIKPPIYVSKAVKERGALQLRGYFTNPKRCLPGRWHHLWRLANPNVSHLLQARAAYSQNSGIEYRYPLLDRRVFSFFAQLPTDQLSTVTETKKIFRHQLRRHLPHAVTDRPKALFGNLFDIALRHSSQHLLDLTRNSHLAQRGLIHENVFRAEVNQYLEHRSVVPSRLLSILALEDWLRRYH